MKNPKYLENVPEKAQAADRAKLAEYSGKRDEATKTLAGYKS